MNDFFDDNNYEIGLAAKKESPIKNEGHLTVDVYQTDSEIIVQSTIAGAAAGDIDVSVTTDIVTIKGRREPKERIKPSDYFHRELYWGPFSRAIILPVDIDADRAKAIYTNGVLTIRMPKLKSRNKKLKIAG
ncbi:MAG: hypothetical protein A3C88_00550 [Candidatus Yanofskybacteria bacterium RIFCSPHIGHO2_02_FULL_50_12]|uniref:SHSP domain-containing protein n=1 Tax=Candidatus Yanofskybacteria bacterium RIFCSPHIGHO2_02_FULL_50_12 TaxID=1802685 RepID=A0A1F8FVB6_9BACT|nr:MAG: hypothetical protein A3C88_00550 [Candidatus Yanofskybacteria bacterium RIFCSPHIGHO2_02_FULL_50_12]